MAVRPADLPSQATVTFTLPSQPAATPKRELPMLHQVRAPSDLAAILDLFRLELATRATHTWLLNSSIGEGIRLLERTSPYSAYAEFSVAVRTGKELHEEDEGVQAREMLHLGYFGQAFALASQRWRDYDARCALGQAARWGAPAYLINALDHSLKRCPFDYSGGNTICSRLQPQPHLR